jgi:hypothetical protein
MIQPQLLLRLNALLDRPQEFLVYSGGEGGEFFSNRIGQYSSVHQHAEQTQSTVNSELNRTMIVYPELYQYIMNNLPFEVGSRENLIDLLVESELVTDLNLHDCEQFFDQSGVPLFRMHKVEADLFTQHPCHFLSTVGLWREYAHALTVIKVGATPSQFLEHITARGLTVLEGRYSLDQVQAYMLDHDLHHASFVLYRALVVKDNPLTLEQAFELTASQLYHGYFQRSLHQAQSVSWLKHVRQHGGSLLDLRRIVCEPHYLADRFHIEDHQEFHEGVAAWHHANLDLLLAHGFTEFESLRLS